jgi:hypothetical protein
MAGEPNTYSDGDVDEIIFDLSKRSAELELLARQLCEIILDKENTIRAPGLAGAMAEADRLLDK